jgi:CHAT domain
LYFSCFPIVRMFQEFQISVTPLDRDRYLVRTENVAPGVPLAEEQVCWSVEEWLEEARQLMNDPLLRVFQRNGPLFIPGSPRPQEDAPSSLIALGQKLYDALFQGSLRDSWITAQGIAHYQRSLLRLRLGLKGNVLPRLPWEVLHTGGKESRSSCYRPLATGTDISFSRYQTNVPADHPMLTLTKVKDRPVRILMAIAGPNDQESLDLQEEAQALQAELVKGSAQHSPAIELTLLPHPGREELTQALEQGQYQVFHYAGHSNLGDSGGDIYLVNNTTGLTETLSGEDLAGLLANNGVQLAVFNSCRGADTALEIGGTAEGERNLAQALVKCGIPAVLAMAERIPDDVAKTLTRLFYRNLNQGYPIDLSLSRARQGLIASYGSNQLYWALPVLYLHPKFDGMLMDSGDETDLAEELFELSEEEEIPLELLAGEGRSGSPFNFMTENPEDDELGFSSPSVAQLTSQNGQYGVGEAAEDLEDEEAFIRGIMSDLAQPETPMTPVPPVSQPPASAPQPTKEEKQRTAPRSRPSPRLAWLPLIFGGIGLGAIALASWWFFFGRNVTPQVSLNSQPLTEQIQPSTDNIEPKSTSNIDFAQVQTQELSVIATDRFIQNNIEQGALAVEALLDPKRNALPQAEAALNDVPIDKQDNPKILFLKGRLAWQSTLRKDKKFSVDDARRYWELAVKKDPNSLVYHNALGFAYYEEGDFNRANQAWSDALELLSKQTASPDKPELTTYAGLALALRQMAKNQPANNQRTLINKALKLRQLVVSQDPVNFQTEALSNNWLWSEKAIQDWKGLIAAESKSGQ